MILSNLINPQSIYSLIRISITLKKMGGWVEAKRTRFFEKEKDIHTASGLPNMFS